jgi:hypothetical protein
VGYGLYRIVAADVNADRHLDLLMTNNEGDAARLLLGTGSFETFISYGTRPASYIRGIDWPM